MIAVLCLAACSTSNQFDSAVEADAGEEFWASCAQTAQEVHMALTDLEAVWSRLSDNAPLPDAPPLGDVIAGHAVPSPKATEVAGRLEELRTGAVFTLSRADAGEVSETATLLGFHLDRATSGVDLVSYAVAVGEADADAAIEQLDPVRSTAQVLSDRCAAPMGT